MSKEFEKKRLNYRILQNETIICIRLRRKVCSQQIFEIVQRLNCYVCLAKIGYSSLRVALRIKCQFIFILYEALAMVDIVKRTCVDTLKVRRRSKNWKGLSKNYDVLWFLIAEAFEYIKYWSSLPITLEIFIEWYYICLTLEFNYNIKTISIVKLIAKCYSKLVDRYLSLFDSILITLHLDWNKAINIFQMLTLNHKIVYYDYFFLLWMNSRSTIKYEHDF